MRNIALLVAILFCATISFAQRKTYDLVTYLEPKSWIKEVKPNTYTSYTITNKQKKDYCKISIMLSVQSKGNLEDDFKSEWETLVASQYKIIDTPQTTAPSTKNGWQIKNGMAAFSFNNGKSIVMVTTMSGYDKVMSIVAFTNSEAYIPAIQQFLQSVEIKQPDKNAQQNTKEKIDPNKNNKVSSTPALSKSSFSFSTTNFDDGWVSTVQENWIVVTKANVKVLIHFSNPKTDGYNSVLKDEDYNAWNTLVAPRYSNMKNFEWRSLQSWESISFIEAEATENSTGKTVHIVLFKKHYNSGGGAYLEFVSNTKSAYENEFGHYHSSAFDWDKPANMQYRNKFAVAASDLNGKWTTNFSGMTQYVNAITGASVGADTHASNQSFIFTSGSTYKWDIGMASGFVGSIKFQSAKSSGKFTMINNWQVKFSDLEGKPKTFDVYFSCIKGGRLLWMSDVSYPGYSAFGKAE